MKPYKTLIAATALTLGATVAMAQQKPMADDSKSSATQFDQNKAVGDGSSGGVNAGAKDKIPSATTGAAATGPATNGSGMPAKDTAKIGVDKEGKTGDAVTTTGTGKMNQKKQ